MLARQLQADHFVVLIVTAMRKKKDLFDQVQNIITNFPKITVCEVFLCMFLYICGEYLSTVVHGGNNYEQLKTYLADKLIKSTNKQRFSCQARDNRSPNFNHDERMYFNAQYSHS